MGFVSFNGDGDTVTFDSDFEILSQATDASNAGFFGSGLVNKTLADTNADKYVLTTVTGEPHGMLYFSVILTNCDIFMSFCVML